MYKLLLLGLIALALFVPSVAAQEATVVVPDLTGLNVPQAAAILNAVGLRLGNEESGGWTDGAGLARGSISAQSLAPSTIVTSGTVVDVSVLQSPNMLLLYDDNDLTVVNLSANVADVTGLRFTSVEGNPAALAAIRWASNLRNGQCLQAWSISRNGPKGLDDCQFIQNWLTTNNTGEHFWTQANGVQRFAVLEEGIERATCPAAPVGSQDNPLRCEFFYAGAGAGADVTNYLYFAYTPDAIVIINQSNDKWMPTDRTTIFNFNPGISNPGAPLIFGDTNLLREEFTTGFGDVTRLAPGQCIMFSTNHPEGTKSPQPCNVIAQRDLSPQIAFWLADFEIESATDGQRHTCPAASAGRPTLCILPR
jgi:hypothetical protein